MRVRVRVRVRVRDIYSPEQSIENKARPCHDNDKKGISIQGNVGCGLRQATLFYKTQKVCVKQKGEQKINHI